MVNLKGLLAPDSCLTLISRTPAAPVAVIVALIVVELSTATFATVTPWPLTETIASGVKLAPVTFTCTARPTGTLAGLTQTTTGAGTGVGGLGGFTFASIFQPGFSPEPAYAPRKSTAPPIRTLE